jgi:predicted chitinase
MDADLYTRTGEGEQSVFTKTTGKTPKDSTKILRVADCSPFEDVQHVTWFKVSTSGWMNQSGVDQINQYDLKELGFSTLEQEASPDVSKSLHENWVKGVFDWLSVQLGKTRGIHEKQVSAFYKAMVKEMDKDKDGQLSGRELYNALHHPEAGVRDIAARLVVKHDSEWFGGSSHQRWTVFFQNYDRLRMAYARQWLDDCEWMSQVEAFKSGEPVWHMHPVMFLGAITDYSDDLITYDQLKKMLPPTRQQEIDKYLTHLNETMRIFEINTPLRKAHFMAQILHETGFFKNTEELASGNAYEGRVDLGNTHAGDGPLFKGRGLLQITGRSNYTKCEQYLRGKLGDSSFDITSSISSSRQLSINLRYATLASGYFWRYIKPKLNDVADNDDAFWVSVYVNGWATQEHPYYADRSKEPNHMKERIDMLSITKKAFGLE